MKNRIRELRISKGCTQTKLANDVGISRPYLADIEKGNSAPTTPIALAIAKELNSSVEYIFLDDASYKVYKNGAHSKNREVIT